MSTLSLAGADAQQTQVAIDGQGNAIAVWTRSNGSYNRVQAARRRAGGAWTAPVNISAASAIGGNAIGPQIAIDGHGNAVAVWTRSDGNDYLVQAARLPAGASSWTGAVTLSFGLADAFDQQVAVDRQGNAVVVWTRPFDGNDRVQTARRPVGGQWSMPVNLSAAGRDAGAAQIAANAQGTFVAVWTRFDGTRDRVQAARRPVGGSWSARSTLSAASQVAGNPQVAIDGQGTATAVWQWHEGDSLVQAARQPAGGSWSGSVNVSASGANATNPQVALDGQGNAVAVWTASDGTNTRVQTARRPASGNWGAPLTLSAPGADNVSPEIAVNAHGTAVAVWTRYGTNHRVQSARRPAGGTWRAPVGLSDVGGDADYTGLAIDGQDNAVAVWARVDASLHRRVQARGLDAAGPVSTMRRPTRWAQTATSFALAWSAVDRWSPVASYDVRYRYAPYNGGFGTTTLWRSATTANSHSFSAHPGRTYCFSARARDTVDNLGAWSARRCTAIPLDDHALGVDSHWTRRAGSGFYLGTYTAAHTTGATLTRSGVQAKRLALLVTSCATCGAVKVSFAGTNLGTFSLASATTAHRKIISIRTFAAVRAGTLKIQIVSAGKPVYIDGVVVSRV